MERIPGLERRALERGTFVERRRTERRQTHRSHDRASADDRGFGTGGQPTSADDAMRELKDPRSTPAGGGNRGDVQEQRPITDNEAGG
jgi:hypothetical protein